MRAYRRDLAHYQEFLGERSPSPELASAFVAELSVRDFAPSTIARRIAAIRGLHRFVLAEGLDAHDPTQLLGTPRLGASLPKALTVVDVTRLLERPDTSTAAGRRDRAMFEFLYGTGCRVGELVAVDLDDLDLEQATAIVTGKGSKQRMVPLGRYAQEAIGAYLPDRLVWRRPGGGSGALFLNQRGGRLTRQGVWTILKDHGNAIGLADELSPHVLRHSAATHMVEGGADLRTVQEMLGHATIRTTQVYTNVSPQHIREVYITSHPRGR